MAILQQGKNNWLYIIIIAFISALFIGAVFIESSSRTRYLYEAPSGTFESFAPGSLRKERKSRIIKLEGLPDVDMEEVDKLPMIHECDQENIPPEEIDYIKQKAAILLSLDIKDGYVIGRGPRGYGEEMKYCDVGIYKKKYPEMDYYEKVLFLPNVNLGTSRQPFKLKEEDLEKVAWLFFDGEFLDREYIVSYYNAAKEMPSCEDEVEEHDIEGSCLIEGRMEPLPEVADWEITEEDGKKILHKYGIENIRIGEAFIHYKISITEEGKAASEIKFIFWSMKKVYVFEGQVEEIYRKEAREMREHIQANKPQLERVYWKVEDGDIVGKVALNVFNPGEYCYSFKCRIGESTDWFAGTTDIYEDEEDPCLLGDEKIDLAKGPVELEIVFTQKEISEIASGPQGEVLLCFSLAQRYPQKFYYPDEMKTITMKMDEIVIDFDCYPLEGLREYVSEIR